VGSSCQAFLVLLVVKAYIPELGNLSDPTGVDEHPVKLGIQAPGFGKVAAQHRSHRRVLHHLNAVGNLWFSRILNDVEYNQM